MKQELEQLRMSGFGKSEAIKEEEETIQLQGIHVALGDLEVKENQLKDRIEEAKSWSQVVSGSSNK